MSLELHKKTIKEIHQLIQQKELSYTELALAYLNFAQDKNPELNAYLYLESEDTIKRHAAKLDQDIENSSHTIMTGIPIAFKDNILVENLQCTAGSLFLQHYQAQYDATVTRKIKDLNMTILGKTNCDEFAMGASNENSAFGPAANPWNTKHVPGGSSGGSASAVAGLTTHLALGTDTGGSVRQPAALCGIVGLKPTYGRISRYGVIAFASSLDQVGPMARRVQDCAFLFESLAGPDPFDSTTSQATVPFCADSLDQGGNYLKGKRIGYAPAFLPEEMSGEIKDNFFNTIKQLESLGAIPVEIELPHAKYGVACYYIIAPAEASSNLARFDGIRYTSRAESKSSLEDLIASSRSKYFGSEVKRRILLGTFVLSSGYYDAYYIKAQKIRSLIKEDFQKAFEKVDIIISPSSPSVAPTIGNQNENPIQEYLSDVFTVPVSVSGLPALSVPSGFSQDGLPMGIQLIGNYFQENTLFQAAYAYEEAHPYHKELPL